jgi:hypothetical protein
MIKEEANTCKKKYFYEMKTDGMENKRTIYTAHIARGKTQPGRPVQGLRS